MRARAEEALFNKESAPQLAIPSVVSILLPSSDVPRQSRADDMKRFQWVWTQPAQPQLISPLWGGLRPCLRLCLS